MKKTMKWMIAAILIISGMTMSFTSCSDDDEIPVVKGPEVPDSLLFGLWYCVYDATGIAHDDINGENTFDYTHVMDVYNFKNDGKGSFNRLFFGDADIIPGLVQGLYGAGTFSYTPPCEKGNVGMTLDYDRGQPYPRMWKVNHDGKSMTGNGIDGQRLTLSLASDDMKAVISGLSVKKGNSAVAASIIEVDGTKKIDWNGMLYTIASDKTAKVIGHMALFKESSIVIPTKVNVGTVASPVECDVVAIADNAFTGCNNIVSLTVDHGVRSIGKSAFRNCNNLETLSLPVSLKSIGEYAFADCQSLTTVTPLMFSKGVSIASNAFDNCPKLQHKPYVTE